MSRIAAWVRKIRWLLLALALPLGCASSDGDLTVSLDATSVGPLKALPGVIGVALSTYRDDRIESKYFEISAGQVREVPSLPKAPKNATSSILPDGGTTLPFPHGSSLMYAGPYLISPDKTRAIASVTFKDSWNFGPYAYIIGDLTAKKVIFVPRKESELFIEGVAWSSNSKFVALLRKKQVTVLHGPIEILSACSGHPAQYSNYVLEIIDAQGRMIAKDKITAPLTGTWGEVVWMSGTSNTRSHADAREQAARAGEARR